MELFPDSLQQLVALITWFLINVTELTAPNAMETTFNEENDYPYCMCVCSERILNHQQYYLSFTLWHLRIWMYVSLRHGGQHFCLFPDFMKP